jgi:hypothetical protein
MFGGRKRRRELEQALEKLNWMQDDRTQGAVQIRLFVDRLDEIVADAQQALDELHADERTRAPRTARRSARTSIQSSLGH